MPKQAVPLIKVGGYHRNAWVVFTEIRRKKKIRYYKPDNRKFFAVSDIEAFIMSGIVVEPVKSIE